MPNWGGHDPVDLLSYLWKYEEKLSTAVSDQTSKL